MGASQPSPAAEALTIDSNPTLDALPYRRLILKSPTRFPKILPMIAQVGLVPKAHLSWRFLGEIGSATQSEIDNCDQGLLSTGNRTRTRGNIPNVPIADCQGD
jgi:hypothetical protein